MSEQKRYVGFRSILSGTMKRLCIVFIALSPLALGACMPTGQENVNTELFKDKEDLKARAAELKPGITKQQAFAILGIPPEKFERMSMADVQTCVYGNSQVQGTPQQLEEFRQRIMSYEGYALPYRALNSDGSLGFGTMKIHKQGHDLRLVLVFERNRLLRAAVEGTENVSQENNRYLWSDLISKGIGLAF